ncbi:hypothetical protein BDW69DRAFT_203236 [Aspergillus filifer]
MELGSSPHPNDDGFPFDEFIYDPDTINNPNKIEMNKEEKGCYFVKSGTVDEAIRQSLSAEERLATSPESVKDLDFAAYPVKTQWQGVMEYGINMDVALLRHFGTAKGVFRQGPVLALSTSGTRTGLRKAHPCRCGMSLWRPMCGTIGLLKVYPGSHHISTEDELRRSGIKAVNIQILVDQALFTDGGIWVEEDSRDDFLLWMGMSKGIIGLYIDRYCLEFVALAYSASRFLLRHRPPETETTPVPEVSPLVSHQIGPPIRRSETAIPFFGRALQSFLRTKEFINELQDPTCFILQKYSDTDNPTVTFLSVGQVSGPDDWFLRALVVRYLTRLYYSRGRTIKDFIEEKRLPHNAQGAISNGKKLYSLEQTLGNPGIWLFLMSVFPRVLHLPSRELIGVGDLICGDQDVLNCVLEWTQLVNDCTQLYSTLDLGL